MSNIFRSENLEHDFTEFLKNLYKSNRFKYPSTDDIKPSLKRYHRATYVIALLEIKLKSKWQDVNKFLYLSEILSDLLSNSAISVLGFYYSSQILTRRLIENFYHHVYYFDHPVEYELLNLGRNEYVPIIELKKYYEAHPFIFNQKDVNIKIFNDQLFKTYQELCRTVHTKGEDFMGLAPTITEIKPNIDIKRHLIQISDAALSIIYLLYKFHLEVTLTNVEKDLVAKCFPKSIRGSLFS